MIQENYHITEELSNIKRTLETDRQRKESNIIITGIKMDIDNLMNLKDKMQKYVDQELEAKV